MAVHLRARVLRFLTPVARFLAGARRFFVTTICPPFFRVNTTPPDLKGISELKPGNTDPNILPNMPILILYAKVLNNNWGRLFLRVQSTSIELTMNPSLQRVCVQLPSQKVIACHV